VIEVGEITKLASFFSLSLDPLWYDPGEYPYNPRYPRIYSEIMNNFQNTNYHYSQKGTGTWSYSVTTHQGGWQRPEVTRHGWDIAQPLIGKVVQAEGKGLMPSSFSFFSLDSDHVKIITVKRAEDGRGLILRLYEDAGIAGSAWLTVELFDSIRALRTDISEHDLEELPSNGNSLGLEFSPFQIITLRIIPL
jgi:alpha-mannosidase